LPEFIFLENKDTVFSPEQHKLKNGQIDMKQARPYASYGGHQLNPMRQTIDPDGQMTVKEKIGQQPQTSRGATAAQSLDRDKRKSKNENTVNTEGEQNLTSLANI
jgi:hypothetical protein